MPSFPEIRPTIGSISSGTLRTEDLIENFMAELEVYRPEKAEAIKAEYNNLGGEIEFDPESEDASWLLQALIEALEDLAPPYCYFGSTPGDGAEFGFWPQDLNEIADFNPEVLKVNNLPEFLMLVNDHGNVTMYRVKELEEVWSVV